ncbi:hypothetical protein COLO4_36408 [Corchorus olitorius]|uniref:Uncharacterized protein n=1 Tax=Corchorus olitorius TaxID=93759 RepID=A0A1R3G902_9ROSI|nr:hypothetical protein COLO4_36408 [Corchorus olitorius]
MDGSASSRDAGSISGARSSTLNESGPFPVSLIAYNAFHFHHGNSQIQ